jgi:heme A synthase
MRRSEHCSPWNPSLARHNLAPPRRCAAVKMDPQSTVRIGQGHVSHQGPSRVLHRRQCAVDLYCKLYGGAWTHASQSALPCPNWPLARQVRRKECMLAHACWLMHAHAMHEPTGPQIAHCCTCSCRSASSTVAHCLADTILHDI